jgi:hypothetical protein
MDRRGYRRQLDRRQLKPTPRMGARRPNDGTAADGAMLRRPAVDGLTPTDGPWVVHARLIFYRD